MSPEITFYVLEAAHPLARLKLACRIVEKAYRAGQHVLVWHDDPAELATLDELLWTFDERTFLPHERVVPGEAAEAPVLLSTGELPGGDIPVLVNLAPEIPECAARAARVIEIIDADPSRREAGRARFRSYRDRGLQPVSHNVRAD